MNIQKQLTKASKLCEQNNFIQAKQILSDVLKKFPNQPNTLKLLSEILIFEEDLQNAEPIMDKLLVINSLSEQAIMNLINIKLELQKPEQAKVLFQKITNLRNANYYINFIKTHRILNQLDEINNLIDSPGYQQYSQDLDVILTLGFTYNYFGKYKQALALYETQRDHFIKESRFLFNYAITLNNNRSYDQAINVFRQAEQIDNNNLEIKKNIAASYMFEDRYDEAIRELDRCKKLNPHDLDVDIKKAFIYLLQEKKQDALEIYNKIINENPNYHTAYLHKGFVKLNLQEFDEGWDLYRHRQLVDQKKCLVDDFNLLQINWDKDICIYQEQGIGDWIFHIRMLSLISEKHHNISLYVDERLHGLIKINFPKIKLLSTIQNQVDIQKINMGSIGRYVVREKKQIKTIKPWVIEPEAKGINVGQKIKIGISWRSQNKEWGDDKSMSLNLFGIFKNDFDLINLQYGDVDIDIGEFKLKHNIDLISDKSIDIFNNISGLSQLINSCDFIVTISNVTAHLAGACGKKTFLMLPKNNGKMWYWSKDENSKSIWYPSVHIISFDSKQGWQGSINRVYELINSI